MAGTMEPVSYSSYRKPGRLHPLHHHASVTLPLMLVLSAGLHLLGMWGLFAHPVFSQGPRFNTPIKVKLITLPQGRAGAVSGTPGKTVAAPQPPEPQPPKIEKPKTTLPGKPEPKAKPSKAPVATQKKGVAAGLGHKDASVGLGGKGAGIIMDEANFQYAWYKARLEDILKSHWQRPPLKEHLTASVHFIITAAGDAINVHLVQSSGNSQFDQSVLRAVYAAAPFPKFPPQYQSDRVGVLYTFELVPEQGQSQ